MDAFKTLKPGINLLFTGIMLLIYSFSFSQNTAAYTLDFVNGISSPLGDFQSFSELGHNSSFIINKSFCKHISVGLNTNYTSLPLKEPFNVSNEKWSSFSFSIGPQYNVDIKKVSVQFYGRLGLSFISIPEIINFYPETNVTDLNFNESKTNGLNTRLGINLGTQVCNGLSFFTSAEYTSNLYSNVNYQTRDVSGAIGATGQIDPDLASAIAFENSDFSFSSFNINFGIRLNINQKNNRNSTGIIQRDIDTRNVRNSVGKYNDGGNGSGTRATDYNSSRSNKSENNGIVNNDTNGGNGSGNNTNGNKSTDATDYNSSRSNKSEDSGVVNNDTNGENGFGNHTNGNKSTDATDYNSSRSNKSEDSGVINNNTNGENGFGNNTNGNKSTDATDYNSSRSNKSEDSGVVNNDTNGGNGIENSEIISRMEEKTILNGKLLGMLIFSRKFEFKKDNGDKIIGTINSQIPDEQLTQYSSRYLNKNCKIKVIIIRTSFIKGKEKISYELVEIL